MKNLFIGVQSDLRPIKPSLFDYLASLPKFDRCIVRAPMGLKLDQFRPLQFDDVLTGNTDHLQNSLDNVTVFIGSPDLIPASSWLRISQTIEAWYLLGCRSICFEAMVEWNKQFQFAYDCCKIANIKTMAEGIPTNNTPLDTEILLSSQRYVHRFRIGELQKGYNYNVIVRRDSLKFPGVYKGLFGKIPETLDELQNLIQSTGAEVFRYDIEGDTVD